MSEKKDGLHQIILTGKNPELFTQLFSKLEESIVYIVEKISSTNIEPEAKAVIGEVLQATQSFVEAKLKEPSLKNKKLLAEITKLYVESEEKLAATRERHAAAEKIELENIEKRLELAIKMMGLMEKIRVISTPDGVTIDLTGKDE